MRRGAGGARVADGHVPRGAPTMELTDLTPPGAPLFHEATLGTGARPWSRVVEKMIS